MNATQCLICFLCVQGDCPALMAVRALLGPALALTDSGRASLTHIATATATTDATAVSAPGVDAGASWLDVLAPTGAGPGTTDGGRTDTLGQVLARGMSTPARDEVLCQLAAIVAGAWFRAIAPTPGDGDGDRGSAEVCGNGNGTGGGGGGGGGGVMFSEWGALLLQGEVAAVARSFDEAADIAADAAAPAASATATATTAATTAASSRVRIKAAFAALVWATKLLALDQPADIRRYAMPTTGLDPPLTEERVRALLARRVEFSRDAVQRVKINFAS